MKALFFAEGGPGVGLGHLRRCSALAEGMARGGWDCGFLSSGNDAAAWLAERGLPLAPSRAAVSGRLPEADYSCDALILDSYSATNAEISAKSKGRASLIVAFDDHMNRHESADVIINTGVLAPERSWPGRCERLLGPKYHPLPSEYLPLPKKREIKPAVSRVLVTLGGSGSAEVCERVVAAIRRAFPQAAIDVVLGPYAEELRGLMGAAVHRAPKSLKPLMLDCDLAVASSGQTLFELAATGTPAVAVSLADNQRENLFGMAKAGASLSAGAVGDADFELALAERLSEASSPDTRRRLSEAGRALVDGKGADRAAAVLADILARRRTSR